MKHFAFHLVLIVAAANVANAAAEENAVFKELVERGVKMSDGTAFQLPRPILADQLDAAGQRAAIDRAPRGRGSVKEYLDKSFYAPVAVKVRTLKTPEDEGPAVRAVDVWFVVHGDWDAMQSKDFLERTAGKEENKGRVVSKSGILTNQETAKRRLSSPDKDGLRPRFVYTTFSLFERVEISATRRTALAKDKDSILAAGVVDPRFNNDADYPNRWRELLRDAQAEIKPGPAHPFAHAGGYAKITRLIEPAGAALIECHVVYEEDFGWFDGANLVKQKIPAMVQESVRVFRRKLALAGEVKK